MARERYGDYEERRRYRGYEGYGEYEERPRRRRRKKKSHALYAIVVFVLGAAIIVLGVILLFRVQKINIEGNDYCTNRQIKEMVQNDKYSVNSLYIYGKYLLDKGEVLPCLNSVKISFKSPWEIKVTVKEKEIIAYMGAEEHIYFDKEGLVVYKSNELIEGIPLVEGMEVKKTDLYQKMESSEAGIFDAILETSRELEKYELTTEKIICKNGNIYLHIGKLYVNLGDTVTADKIAQIPPIMDELGRKKGMLHLENYLEDGGTITFSKGETLKEN